MGGTTLVTSITHLSFLFGRYRKMKGNYSTYICQFEVLLSTRSTSDSKMIGYVSSQ